MTTASPDHWTAAVRRRATLRDRVRSPDGTAGLDPLVAGWALGRLAALGVTVPLWGPLVLGRMVANHSMATDRSSDFPDQLDRIAAGEDPLGPANRTARIDGAQRLVVISDLHRGPAGPLDWPRRQHSAAVVDAVLVRYAGEGWTLCENGDVEEFWMVGGTTEGVAYDGLRLAGSVADALGRPDILDRVYRDHLEAIIANNDSTYDIIRDGFAASGRYLRVIGNHDDPLSRPRVFDVLRSRLGEGIVGADFIVAERDGTAEVVITHGHHTDGWNGPGRDTLGKFATWLGSMLRDIPLVAEPGGPPSPAATSRLVGGDAPNRLIPVHPIFGATPTFDTMDEELLHEALSGRRDGPFVIMGHTHSPVASPVSRRGDSWSRYANSGSGVLHHAMTAVEVDGTGDEVSVTLVIWSSDADGPDVEPTRYELSPVGDRLVARVSSLPAGVAEPANTSI